MSRTIAAYGGFDDAAQVSSVQSCMFDTFNCDSSNNRTSWGVYWIFEYLNQCTVPQVASRNIQQNKLQYKLKMFGVFVVVQHFSKFKKPEQFTSYLQSLFLKLNISDKDMLQLSKQEDSSAPSRAA